jgi:hypothetical protein
MRKGFESSTPKCPFYKCETRNTVKCEGVEEVSIIHTFSDADKKRSFKKKYCNNVDSECFVKREKKREPN